MPGRRWREELGSSFKIRNASYNNFKGCRALSFCLEVEDKVEGSLQAWHAMGSYSKARDSTRNIFGGL